MAILIKTPAECQKIKEAGKGVAQILETIREMIRPGITTASINTQVSKLLAQHHLTSSELGYYAYPAVICTSINEEIVHGIPGERELVEGDIISLDLAAHLDGWHADSAITVPVGTISDEKKKLLRITEEALYKGIAMAKVGNRLQMISATIQKYIEEQGYTVVRQYCGHGIGRSMHEDPEVPNYVDLRIPNPVLQAGMVLAIEPMVIAGTDPATQQLADGWTVISKKRTAAAHFEHTIAIHENGIAEVMTKLEHSERSYI